MMNDLLDEEFPPTIRCRGPLEPARRSHGLLVPTSKWHNEIDNVTEWTRDVTDRIEVLRDTAYEHLVDARTEVATLEAEENAMLAAIDASLDAAKFSCAYFEARYIHIDDVIAEIAECEDGVNILSIADVRAMETSDQFTPDVAEIFNPTCKLDTVRKK